MLVKPLGVEVITRSHAPALVALVDAYGEGWARGLLDAWAGRRGPRAAGRDRAAWWRLTRAGENGNAVAANEPVGAQGSRLPPHR